RKVDLAATQCCGVGGRQRHRRVRLVRDRLSSGAARARRKAARHPWRDYPRQRYRVRRTDVGVRRRRAHVRRALRIASRQRSTHGQGRLGMEPSSRDVSMLLEALEALGGLQFSESALLPVQRRIAERVAATGHVSLSKYLDFIASPAGQHELGLALDSITTSETYFLRQEYQYNAFVGEVLPQLLRQNASLKKLTLWSAGCSTG